MFVKLVNNIIATTIIGYCLFRAYLKFKEYNCDSDTNGEIQNIIDFFYNNNDKNIIFENMINIGTIPKDINEYFDEIMQDIMDNDIVENKNITIQNNILHAQLKKTNKETNKKKNNNLLSPSIPPAPPSTPNNFTHKINLKHLEDFVFY